MFKTVIFLQVQAHCSFLLMKDNENKAAELHQGQLLSRQIVHFFNVHVVLRAEIKRNLIRV